MAFVEKANMPFGHPKRVPDMMPTAPSAVERVARGMSELPYDLAVYRDLDEIAEVWRGFESTAVGHPFQRFEWLYHWHDQVGRERGVEPFIVVARDAAWNVVFLAPLAIEPGFLGRRLVWLGQQHCDYNGPLVRADALKTMTGEVAERLWQEIRKRAKSECAYVYLAKQAALLGDRPNPFIQLSDQGHTCAAHMTRLYGPWETFYADKRGTKTRRRLREKLNRLKRRGAVDVRFARSRSSRRELADWLLALKSEQLEAAGLPNTFADDAVKRFFHRIALAQNEDDGLIMAALDVDGAPVAACMGLVWQDRFYYVTAAYQMETFGRESPGQILLTNVMEWAIDQGLEWFDFTIGDEGYKADWCDVHMELTNGLVPLTPRGAVAIAAFSCLLRAKTWVKARPGAMTLARFGVTALRVGRAAAAKIFLGPRERGIPVDRQPDNEASRIGLVHGQEESGQ